MAYIYRYQFKNSKLKNDIDLRNYNDVIKEILEVEFVENLKDSWIEKQYFEFKLYVTVDQSLLRELGRVLKSRLGFWGEKAGFCRMQQELYALIYPDANNEYDIAFIDADVIENEHYKQRSLNYLDMNSTIVFDEVENEGLIYNFYLDVADTHINKKQKIEIFGESAERRCFKVKGYHRRMYVDQINDTESIYRSRVKLEVCIDVAYIKNMHERNIPKRGYIDYLEILIKEDQTEEVAKKIEDQLNLVLQGVTEIGVLNSIVKNKKITFKVHNVGQALATSLAYEGEKPFLYFDYGMPYGSNLRTKPPVINMPTNSGITIILSHVDKDHWFRLSEELNAYECEWFIPDQLRKPLFNHKLAEIIVKGGSVSLVKGDIHFCNGMITCGGISTLNPRRTARYVHETGLAFRLEGYNDMREEMNIFIAGDQMYDYIHTPVLQQIDILVASHHGGKYTWSKRDRIPLARNEESQVVYSYGRGNTHGHPSKIADYRYSGWNNSFHTTSGEFEKNINIR